MLRSALGLYVYHHFRPTMTMRYLMQGGRSSEQLRRLPPMHAPVILLRVCERRSTGKLCINFDHTHFALPFSLQMHNVKKQANIPECPDLLGLSFPNM